MIDTENERFFLPSGSSFLPLMEEKKQKKIKASPRPRKLAGYMIGPKKYQENFPAPAGAFSCIKTRKEDYSSAPKPAHS